MVNICQAEGVRLVFRVGGHFANRGDIFGLQAICNTHLIQIGIAGKRENGRILVLPAKLTDSRLARRLEDRNLNRLTVNRSIALSLLIGSNRKVRTVIDRLYKAISQRVENRAQGSDILRVWYMLLC